MRSKSIKPFCIKKSQKFYLITSKYSPWKGSSHIHPSVSATATPLEPFLWNVIEPRRRFFSHNFLSRLISLPFQRSFQKGEKPELHSRPSKKPVGQVMCCPWQGKFRLLETNFAGTLHVHKFSIKMECPGSVLIPTSWTISWIDTRRFSMIIRRTFSSSSLFRLVGGFYCDAAMFELVVPLYALGFADDIIAKGLLNLLEVLNFSITNILPNLDAIS